MNRTLKLKVADQVSTLNRITSAFVRLQYNINELYVKPASEDGISDMTIKVHIEDEDVYLSLIHISEPTRQCCTSRMPSSA